MTKTQTVQIAEAKGRPMLHWVGKRPLDRVTAFPAQLVERFDPADALQTSEVCGSLLFHGDNKDVLAWLLAHGYRGKVNLIYIDPPFDSGADYVRRVQLRGVTSQAKLEGETYTLGEQIQYTDIWANDMYLQFMYERLLLLKELLAEDGSIYLHCDYRKNAYLRLILDEILGEDNLRNEIVWKKYSGVKNQASRKFTTQTDSIYWYSRTDKPIFNQLYRPMDDSYIEAEYKYTDKDGRRYALLRGRGYVDGKATTKKYLDENLGAPITSLWDENGLQLNTSSLERLGYPTQKPEGLLERIIKASSNPGDLILDCFVGCGTTAAVAQRLGRRWIAADINKGAVQTTSKRLQTIIREQIEAGTVQTSEVSETSEVFLSFSVYRVNDYDLQIQHNEAVNLVVEMIGIERTKMDIFFDGTLGRRLVKIVPFNHPLTLLDLQLVQDEIRTRPDEDRDVVVICLGKETAVDPWLEDYNRHRPVNKIELIELRTDQKYGKFFVHQPAQAQVRIERQDSNIVIEIEDFISPTIVERLEIDTPLFKAQIPDWRAMVDVVLIDTAYDGEVFNIVLSDVPERKNDLVSGRYELPASNAPTTVAVKIIDMLGEEVLVIEEV